MLWLKEQRGHRASGGYRPTPQTANRRPAAPPGPTTGRQSGSPRGAPCRRHWLHPRLTPRPRAAVPRAHRRDARRELTGTRGTYRSGSVPGSSAGWAARLPAAAPGRPRGLGPGPGQGWGVGRRRPRARAPRPPLRPPRGSPRSAGTWWPGRRRRPRVPGAAKPQVSRGCRAGPRGRWGGGARGRRRGGARRPDLARSGSETGAGAGEGDRGGAPEAARSEAGGQASGKAFGHRDGALGQLSLGYPAYSGTQTP